MRPKQILKYVFIFSVNKVHMIFCWIIVLRNSKIALARIKIQNILDNIVYVKNTEQKIYIAFTVLKILNKKIDIVKKSNCSGHI